MKKLFFLCLLVLAGCGSDSVAGLEINKKNCFLSNKELRNSLTTKKEWDLFTSKCLTKEIEEDWKPPQKPLTKMKDVKLSN